MYCLSQGSPNPTQGPRYSPWRAFIWPSASHWSHRTGTQHSLIVSGTAVPLSQAPHSEQLGKPEVWYWCDVKLFRDCFSQKLRLLQNVVFGPPIGTPLLQIVFPETSIVDHVVLFLETLHICCYFHAIPEASATAHCVVILTFQSAIVTVFAFLWNWYNQSLLKWLHSRQVLLYKQNSRSWPFGFSCKSSVWCSWKLLVYLHFRSCSSLSWHILSAAYYYYTWVCIFVRQQTFCANAAASIPWPSLIMLTCVALGNLPSLQIGQGQPDA